MAQECLLVSSENWAVGTDGVQWILWKARKGNSQWYAVSFVRSTKEVLGRCMREKGTPGDVADRLLAALPDRFGNEHVLAMLIQRSTNPVVGASAEQPPDDFPAWQVPPGAGRSWLEARAGLRNVQARAAQGSLFYACGLRLACHLPIGR